MTNPPARLAWLSMFAVVGMLAGCDKAVEPPTAATGAALQSVTIGGLPAQLTVGDRAQLTARATWSDSRSEDVSSRVRWTSRSTTCLVTAAGTVTANAVGDCTVFPGDRVVSAVLRHPR